jgi:hypothetical protein
MVIRLRLVYREPATGDYSEQEEVFHAVPGMFAHVVPPPGYEVVSAEAACTMPTPADPPGE